MAAAARVGSTTTAHVATAAAAPMAAVASGGAVDFPAPARSFGAATAVRRRRAICLPRCFEPRGLTLADDGRADADAVPTGAGPVPARRFVALDARRFESRRLGPKQVVARLAAAIEELRSPPVSGRLAGADAVVLAGLGLGRSAFAAAVGFLAADEAAGLLAARLAEPAPATTLGARWALGAGPPRRALGPSWPSWSDSRRV